MSSTRNRLHALCPYFAMFPESFVEKQVRTYTLPRALVIDSFSGRGTTLLQSLLMDRRALASDLNPVAYCVSGAKAESPDSEAFLDRVRDLEEVHKTSSQERFRDERAELPGFFRRAFYHSTLNQLLFLRATLDWRHNAVDRFVAALILGILHGERTGSKRYLSNQMPRTISPKPGYSIKYWNEHALYPRKRDVFKGLRNEFAFRMAHGAPVGRGSVELSDSRKVGRAFPEHLGEVRHVVTSPPYLDVTHFEEDQWLRLWFLGYADRDTRGQISPDDRHQKPEHYWRFLEESWAGLAPLLRDDAILVCRIGAKHYSKSELTRRVLRSIQKTFPDASLVAQPERSQIRGRQTDAFRPGSKGVRFETDYAVSLGRAGV